jgi:tRNA A37 methylthiotransferase MiaB
MKKISLVQPNFQQGPKEFNAHYLPYSVGVLWAYVNQFESVSSSYQLEDIIWRRDNISDTVAKLKHCDIVGFSTYVWNKNYNYTLARKLKEINPTCIIVFGGPEMPITKKDIFKKLPFIDVVIKSEGEIILKALLDAITDKTSWDSIKGLLINQNGVALDTGDGDRISDLEELPSPYLTGVFDKIMAETTDVEWNATVETNRGCPYACTFCDWGSLTYNKVKKFNLEKVFAELEWIGQKGCGFVTITDANFGMFVERDNAIADKLIEVQEKYGCPNSFSMSWAKDQKPEVFDIVFKLIKNPKFNQGLTVSVQSMDLSVLENIKRKNLAQHKIENIFALCDKNNVPVYTEIILGLPGETKDTWKEGFYKIYRAGNHTGINILHAQMLENAEMNLLQKKLYGITSVPVYDYMSGSYNYNELQECVEVVTGTKDMPTEEMLDSQAFSWFMQTFHINGLTTYISRFLHKHAEIDYSVFYNKLWNYLNTDPWFIQECKELRQYYSNWMIDGKINHPNISNIEVHGWNIIHRTTLNMHLNRKYDYVFDLIENFVMSEFNIDQGCLTQLLQFQRNYVVDYDRISQFPYTVNFDYDFLGYILDNNKLEVPVTYKFDFYESKDISLDRFLENIYFGRKRNFGKAVITQEEGIQ